MIITLLPITIGMNIVVSCDATHTLSQCGGLSFEQPDRASAATTNAASLLRAVIAVPHVITLIPLGLRAPPIAPGTAEAERVELAAFIKRKAFDLILQFSRPRRANKGVRQVSDFLVGHYSPNSAMGYTSPFSARFRSSYGVAMRR